MRFSASIALGVGLLTGVLTAPLWAEVSVQGVGQGGVGQYREGCWGEAVSLVRNTGDEAVRAVLLYQFEERPLVQFGVPVWLPGRSERRVTVPVRLPPSASPQRSDVGVTALLVGGGEGGERGELGEERGEAGEGGGEGELSREAGLLLRLTGRPAVAGLALARDPKQMVEATSAMLQGISGQRRMSYLRPGSEPETAGGYEAVETVVVMGLGGREAWEDEGRLEALRDWVASGGQVWVWMDGPGSPWLGTLIGESGSLAALSMTRVYAGEVSSDRARERFKLEAGATLVRMEVDEARGDVDVLAEVQLDEGPRWPAALSVRVGSGRVVLVTLGSTAWMTPGSKTPGSKTPGSKTPGSETSGSETGGAGGAGGAGEVLVALGRSMVMGVRPVVGAGEVFGGVSEGLVGYEVVSRRWLVGVWLGLLALMGGVYLWVWGRGRGGLPLATGANVMLCGVAALVIGVLWQLQGTGVPATVARGVVREVDSAHGLTVHREVSHYFSPTSGRAYPSIQADGVDSATWWRGDVLTRLVSRDVGWWQVVRPGLPPRSLVTVSSRRVERDSQGWGATLGWDASGAVVSLNLEGWRSPSGPVVVTPRGAAAATWVSAEQLRVSQEAEGVELLTGLTRSAEQLRQQRVYEQARGRWRVTQPELWVWAERSPEAASASGVASAFEDRGMTLLRLPLGAGASSGVVRVPGLFMAFEPSRSPDGRSSSAVYDVANRAWISPLSTATKVWLRFQLPRGLEGLAVTRVWLDVHVEALDRTLRVFSSASTEPVAAFERPLAPQRVELSGAMLPVMDARGGLLVGFEVTEGPASNPLSQWFVRGVGMTVEGSR